MQFVKNIIDQFKDPELLMIIGGVIIALIFLRVIKNFLDRHRLLRVIIVGSLLVGLLLGIWWFIDHRKDFYSNNSTSFVEGEIVNVSSAIRKIEIHVKDNGSNIKNKEGNLISGRNVIVDIDMNCKFINSKGKTIKFDDLGFYDNVRIYTKQSKISDTSRDTLTGVKVIQKSK